MKLETEGDRYREELVKGILESKFPAKFERFNESSEYAELDYITTHSVIELKCRQTETTDYKDVFLSVRKYDALMQANEKLGLVPIFMAAFKDGYILAVDVRKITLRKGVVDRRTPRDSGLVGANDCEPAYLVLLNEMKVIAVMNPVQRRKYRNGILDRLLASR